MAQPHHTNLQSFRILMFVNNNVSHDARVLKEARTLLRAGHQLTVVGVQDRSHVPLQETLQGVPIVRIPRTGWYAALWRRFDGNPSAVSGSGQGRSQGGFIQALKASLKQAWIPFHRERMFKNFYRGAAAYALAHPADVWHIHDLNALPMLAEIPASRRPRVLYDSHELYTELATLTASQRKTYERLERKWIREVDAVITVNESIAGELEQRYGIEPPTVVMNCPERKTDLASHPLSLRREFEIPDADKVILFQGGFTKGRGLEQLIEAMEQVSGAVLVLLGWGPLKPELMRQVDARKLQGKVVFMDAVPQDELLAISRQADIGVIPYRAVGLNNYYTSPNKLFEYIHAGIAVAGSDYPELKKVFDAYGVGCTFDPESPLSIARALQDLVDDPEKLASLKERTAYAAQQLQWEREAEKLVSTYQRLLDA